MGHSSHSFTADTYARLLSGVGKQAAEAADRLVHRKPREQSVSNTGAKTEITLPDEDQEGPLTCEDGRAPSGTRTPNPLKMVAGVSGQLVGSPDLAPDLRKHRSDAALGHRPFGGVSL